MSIAMQEWPRRHRISVEHYYRMAEAGLFEPDERVELIDGDVVDMPPMGPRHAAQLSRLLDMLGKAIGGRAIIRAQLPLRLGESSEPQPDMAVVAPRSDYYEHEHPGANDTLLIVELSDTTLRFDRDVKAPLYARHGVPEAWIVDLHANRLLRFHRSTTGGDSIVAEGELGPAEIGALRVVVDLAALRSAAT